MKRIILRMLILILVIHFISCGKVENRETGSSGGPAPVTLIDFRGMEPSLISQSGSVTTKISGNTLKVTFDASDPNPYIELSAPGGSWDLTGFLYVSFDVKNSGKEDALITCRLNGEPWIEGANIIPAGGNGTVSTFVHHTKGIPEYLTEAFFGMNGIPGKLTSIPVPGYDVHYIYTLKIMFTNPASGHTLKISDIRAEPGIRFYTREELADGFFPFVDEFGQFRHSEWEGKIHSIDELKNTVETENEELQSHPGPEDWDRFGGWAAGPQLRATGHFRTEKYQGKWWLVDPEGRLFWSHGLDEVSAGNATPVTEREHYFPPLPSRDEYPGLYSDRSTAPFGYYKGKTATSFNVNVYNLMRKYGESWQDKFTDITHRRLRSWGMNKMGAWSADFMYNARRTPYTMILHSRGRNIEGSEGHWTKFPDPFDEGWKQNISDRLMQEKSVSASDTFCIGYFVDNELSWGNNTFLAVSTLKSPADQPVKLAFSEFLRGKYTSISGLNKAWKTDFRSWDEFLASTDVPENIDNDLREFNILIARQYLGACRDGINRHAPGKLYLGARWDFHMYPLEDTTGNWLLRIAAEYCDVISFNRYRYSCFELCPPEGIDMPVMITEWHIGTFDRGMFHFGLRFATSLENQNLLYKNYVHEALSNPYIVGAHWFRYSDQALTSRQDGENYRIGFIDICDRPYRELVDASRTTGYNMYMLRMEK